MADTLSAGRLDVALIPSVEFFRTPGLRVVSDACVACRGPVLSVKLHFRVPPKEVRRVALDEGSRTSAALTQILLAEMCDVRPEWEPLPIGCGAETTDADAVLLIGDRAISNGEWGVGSGECGSTKHYGVWDLGEQWSAWTGLPFVFALWIGRDGANMSEMAGALGGARDQGVRQLDEIAEREGPLVGVSVDLAKTYLRDNLHFTMGAKEREGLQRFYELCVAHGLAPSGLEGVLKGVGKVKACRK